MQSPRNTFIPIFLRLTSIFSLVSILVSCQLSPSITNTAEAPTEIADQTIPVLPETFQTDLLNPVDVPHTYVEETCRYLRNKWNPANAQPGTVVMLILIKDINRGAVELPNSIRITDFYDLLEQLKAQGFEAINTEKLQAFLERNLPIPPRSVVLIQDGNHTEEYFDKNYRWYYEQWGWTVVNGFVSDPNIDPVLREGNFSLEYEGFIDHQARGITPDVVLTDDIAKTIIARELQGSLEGFAEQLGKTPNAIIWPNGGFGIRPIEAARQLRFKLGVTQNPRGPVMYNWVPLANSVDDARPTLIPEGKVGDPLMTLPAYSPQEAFNAIDSVRNIGNAAQAYAESNKDAEYQYYDIVCSDKYGPIPTP